MAGISALTEGGSLPIFGNNVDYSNANIIAKNRAPNINHEIFLKDEQKEMKRILSRDELKKRQDELVKE